MIKSMTGFGKAICQLSGRSANIEIKSLNSKQLDLNIRVPNYYKEKELELRTEASKMLVRGKIDLSVFMETTEDIVSHKLNAELVKSYYRQVKQLSDDLEASDVNVMNIVMRMPDVLQSEKPSIEENEWFLILNGLKDALVMLDDFRMREGKILEEDFMTRILAIQRLLTSIEAPEKSRIVSVKEKIQDQLEQIGSTEAIDKNRFEQELVYYLEKMDIAEEKTRLKSHCDFFMDTLRNEESSGKKLNFISQEIGREINTIGSKANDADMQKIVVEMKEELEKIKEQLANVL